MADDTTAASPTLNPFEPGFFDDPYRQYAAIREAAPITRSPVGAWVVARYDDVVRILRDPALSVEIANASVAFEPAPEVAARINDGAPRGTRAILNLDPPDHHRIRRLVAKVFTPVAIEQMRPHVRGLVDAALDAVEHQGSMDVISDLAFPLPFTVISEMMGIPEGVDRLELRAWSSTLVKTLDPILTVDEQLAALDAAEAMRDYLQSVIAYKRGHPDDLLLSGLIAAEEDGDKLSADELIDQVVLLYIAGHETTVNLIGNGTLALLRNPEQMTRLCENPELDANAVEELLRFDSPVQFSRRIALEPFEVQGTVVEAGGLMMVMLGAANRDPRHWGPTADELDLGRRGAAQHVSFGGGVHHCLGAFLARLEGQEAIPALVRRFPRMRLARDTLVWNGRIVLRGLESLPVRWEAS